MKCVVCNKEFEGKRSTAKYCSANCRLLAFRKTGEDETLTETLTPPIETLTPANVAEVLEQADEQADTMTDADIEALPVRVVNEVLRVNAAIVARGIPDDLDLRMCRAARYFKNMGERYHSSHFTGELDAIEGLCYRPADRLGRGEFNPVSKPGHHCYRGVMRQNQAEETPFAPRGRAGRRNPPNPEIFLEKWAVKIGN